MDKEVDYNDRARLNQHGRNHCGCMRIGVTPAGAEKIVPECLHLKKCIGSRMLAMNQDTHAWLAGVS